MNLNNWSTDSGGIYNYWTVNNGLLTIGQTTGTPVTCNLPCIAPTPVINANSATTFCQGNSVTLTSTLATSYLWSNGATTQGITVSAVGNYSVQISTTVPSGATAGLISVINSCGPGISTANFTTNNFVTLNLKLFLEGYYQPGNASGGLMNNGGSGGMLKLLGISANAADVDTVYISAMGSAAPYNQIDKKAGILKTDGTVRVTFGASVLSGTSYYIKVNHRNSLETWSSLPVLLTNV